MAENLTSPFGLPLAFLVGNVVLLMALHEAQRRGQRREADRQRAASLSDEGWPAEATGPLPPADLLGWELEYARTTASEAMQDRHQMINFYLLATGVVATGVIGLIGSDRDVPHAASTLLLWMLCGVGWIYFLKLIQLRRAWIDSARTMLHIRDFYGRHVSDIAPAEIQQAFRWKLRTLPPAGKPWTVFFYSAALIGFIDSAAFVGGSYLLDAPRYAAQPVLALWPAGLGILFFLFHNWLYMAMLRPVTPEGTAAQ